MITENELRISNESYTHKDFYQIYPEILDLVNKITERWDPASSNESDPGVVLLKLLAFIGDKLNYNIDKNILEAFMPSATQEDSMRKLCEMMGYDMKYYRSAVADVSFMWVGNNLPVTPSDKTYIYLDRFTEIQDDLGEVNFILTEPVSLNARGNTETKKAIEGTIQTFEINDDNLVKLYNLDDNRRLYLPESQIAENGIWICNALDDENKDVFWTKVDNLNTQQPMQKVWKFGFDSKKRLPYILFPEDISELIGNGLKIKYIRTSGATGNIAPKTLTKLTKLENVKLYNGDSYEEVPIEEDGNVYLNIQNPASTSNGSDYETLNQAYDAFKKKIGTFDTLITCRDYANKIYELVKSDLNTTNYVSNVQVTDIKDDINLSTKIVSFDQFGVLYSDIPIKTKPVYKKDNILEIPLEYDSLNKIFYCNKEYYQVSYIGTGTPSSSSPASDFEKVKVDSESINRINNFDIYMYPLLNINNFYSSDNYNNSFKPDYVSKVEIIRKLEDFKTLSHNLKQLANAGKDYVSSDIYNIKNYYHLNAKISTTYKVTEYEASQILNNIYYALWNNFNARKLDYGEEIPFDQLLSCIEKADSRIKVVSLEEPELRTAIMKPTGEEINILNYDGTVSATDSNANVFYSLVAKNVLAGKLPLFNYDKRFDYNLGEVNAFNNMICGKECNYKYTNTTTAPTIAAGDAAKYSITAITTELKIPVARLGNVSNPYVLKKNEGINLICPNLKTVKEGLYSAYVNYFFKLGNSSIQPAIACELTKIKSNTEPNYFDYYLITFQPFVEVFSDPSDPVTEQEWLAKINELSTRSKYVWYKTNNVYSPCTSSTTFDNTKTYYITKNINSSNWTSLLSQFSFNGVNEKANGLFYIQNSNITNIPGELIDENHNSYRKLQSFDSTFDNREFYACLPYSAKQNFTSKCGIVYSDPTSDTIGKSLTPTVITKNTEYLLKNNDILYINYTDSNDVVHNISYYKRGSKFYKRDDIGFYNTGLEVEFSGIIKPNFDLYDSNIQATTGYGKSYSKKDGYVFPSDIVPGMFALEGQNQIEIRDFVNTELKEFTYCYWSTLNPNCDLVFSKIPSSSEAGSYVYEYILNDDEYFFYTDSLKNSLITLSSGTSLKIISESDKGDKITYKLNDSTVSLEDISSDGIGAFNDTKWIGFKLNENYYLRLEENQIISLAEKDTITGITELKDPYTGTVQTHLANDWEMITDATDVKYNNQFLPKFDFGTTYQMTWKIRSMLNLNMNDEEGQLIEKDSATANSVIQSIKLYTSFYTTVPVGTEPARYVDYNPNEKQLEVCGDSPSTLLTKFESSSTYLLKSNYALNQPGGKLLSMHRYTVEKIQKDDLYIYPYNKENLTYKKDGSSSYQDAPISMYADEYYKFSFREASEYILPVFVPQNSMGLLMIYYSPSNQVDNYPQVSLGSISGNKFTPVSNTVQLYRKSYNGTYSSGDSVTLEKGINVIRIKQPGYIRIKKQNQSTTGITDLGTLVISDLDVVDIDSNVTGVNYELLNIPKSKCADFIQNFIVNSDLDNLFYYNVPIDKYNELDVNLMDQYSWFNYNNICNKFVIAQLDNDFKDIQIAKSSRVSKW